MWNNATKSDESILNISSIVSSNIDDRPACYTAVAWRVYLTKEQSTVLAVSYSSTVIPTIVLNLALCFYLLRNRNWKEHSRLLIFILSLSDMLMGFVSIPGSVLLCTLFSHRRHCLIERAVVFFGQTNGHFSFYITLAIAMHRYVKNRWKVFGVYQFLQPAFTKSGLKIMILVLFLISCVHGVVSTYFFGLVSSSLPNIIMMVVRGVILLAIQCCYFRLYITVKRHFEETQAAIKNMPTDSKHSDERELPNIDKISKVNRVVLIIMVLLATSFLPATIADVWTGYYTLIKGTKAPMLPRFAFYLSFTAIFLNGALNAAVFIHQSWASFRRIMPLH